MLAATLAAAALRLFRLGAQSLWIDEVLTWYSANVGGPFGIHDLTENVHGPLHALAVHWAGSLAGDSEWSLRLPSALAGIATVPAMAWLAARWLGRETAAWAAWVTALSPFLIWYSQEARPYAMTILFVCLSGAALLHATRAGRVARIAYGGAALAGLLSSPSFAFVLPVHARWWLADPAARARRTLGVLLALAVLALAALPWAPQAWRTWDWHRLHPGRAPAVGETQLRGATTFHAAAIPFALHAFAVGYTLGPSLRELRASPSRATLVRHAGELAATAIVFLAFGALAVAALARRRRLADALLWAGVPLLVVSWFAFSNFKVFHPRYLAVASPLFLLGVAAALADAGPRARAALGGALLALWTVSLAHHYAVPAYGKEDLRGAARLITGRAGAGEQVIAVNSIDPMLYYYRGRAPLVPFWLGFAADAAVLERRFDERRAARPDAWVVLSRPEDLDPSGRFARMMDARFPGAERFAFEGVRVWHVRGQAAPASGAGGS